MKKDQQKFLCKWCGKPIEWKAYIDEDKKKSGLWLHDDWVYCSKMDQKVFIDPVPEGCLLTLKWEEA